jgi:carboxymethylenebutenolidase
MLTQTTSLQSGKRLLEAYLAYPDGSGPFPGILVIHEADGLNENIRDITRRFAGQGYAALAVDLFSQSSRIVCMLRLLRGMLMNSLDHGGVRDLRAALNCLAAQPKVNPDRLGAVGYCLGGGLAIALACSDQRLKAIAPYYGMNPRPLEAVQRMCPVVGSYPGEDFTTSMGQKLELELDHTGTPHDIKIYPGAKHSFFNDSKPSRYHAEAAADSWQRVMAFFGEHV